MPQSFQEQMHEAKRLTQAGRLLDATRLIQRALAPVSPLRTADANTSPDVLDGLVREVDDADEVVAVDAVEEVHEVELCAQGPVSAASPDFNRGRQAAGSATFATGQFVRDAQTHHYKLYTPPQAAASQRLPLVVMLHGCTQNPDDFSVGTAMNDAACAQGFYVLYPSQQRAANSQGCWNWFERGHQQRDAGEPAWIAELTLQLLRTLPIDSRRVYIAGLSAGGAMAAVIASAYPEIFAALGVHSGLPVGAARNLAEALNAMKRGAPQPARVAKPVPSIVFHGDQDRTVHAANARGLVDASVAGVNCAIRVERGAAKGRKYTRNVYEREGKAQAELWQLHGAGHAWSGGNPAGSYADARGTDATAEMLRFFWLHQGALSAGPGASNSN